MLRGIVCHGAPVVDQNPVYVVIGYHGLDNQCIAVQMVNVTCISLIESDIFHLTLTLLDKSLVGRPHGRNQPFPGLSEVAVLGS